VTPAIEQDVKLEEEMLVAITGCGIAVKLLGQRLSKHDIL